MDTKVYFESFIYQGNGGACFIPSYFITWPLLIMMMMTRLPFTLLVVINFRFSESYFRFYLFGGGRRFHQIGEMV